MQLDSSIIFGGNLQVGGIWRKPTTKWEEGRGEKARSSRDFKKFLNFFIFKPSNLNLVKSDMNCFQYEVYSPLVLTAI